MQLLRNTKYILELERHASSPISFHWGWHGGGGNSCHALIAQQINIGKKYIYVNNREKRKTLLPSHLQQILS